MDPVAITLAIALTAVGVAAVVARRAATAATRRAEALEVAVRDLEGARDQVSEEQADLVRAIEAMEDGVVLVDAAGRVRSLNRAAAALLGGRPTAVTGLSPVALRGLLAAAVEGPATLDVEVGAPTRVLRGSARVIDTDGDVLLLLRDVTDAVRIDAIRRDFIANASHELKTPLATIRATAETLAAAAADDPAAVPGFAARIEDEAERLGRIVTDLLDLSRLEGGDAGDDRVDLAAIAREEAARLGGEAAARGVAVDVSGDAQAVAIGSERDLRLLVRNLVENAVRHTEPDGHVAIEVRADGGDAVVAVRDDGIGIPTRDIPRVFERFYRVDRARARDTGGTGLGLAIVKHVAENHGGRATIESELGRGTTVEVRIPIPGRTP